MMKAFPDINKTETFDQLAIQQFLNGISDQDIAFEVIKLSPTTLAEAVDRLTWLESCKQSIRRKPGGLRKVDIDEQSGCSSDEEEENQDVRRVNGKKFVTEERLIQFARDASLREQRKLRLELQDFKNNLLKAIKDGTDLKHLFVEGRDVQQKPKDNVICYFCSEEGHISPKCPNKPKYNNTKAGEESSDEKKTLNSKGLSLLAKPQPSA